MLEVLGKRDVTVVDDAASDEDWYANIVWIDRRKYLLLTHAATLFPVLAADVRARDLRPPGPFVVERIQAALVDEDLPVDVLSARWIATRCRSRAPPAAKCSGS